MNKEPEPSKQMQKNQKAKEGKKETQPNSKMKRGDKKGLEREPGTNSGGSGYDEEYETFKQDCFQAFKFKRKVLIKPNIPKQCLNLIRKKLAHIQLK